MPRGDLVIVRAFGAKPLIRRVWEETDEAVYIHDEENYQKHAKGIHYLDPVGFHRDAVFAYDAVLFPEDAEDVPQHSAFWAQLKRYGANE